MTTAAARATRRQSDSSTLARRSDSQTESSTAHIEESAATVSLVFSSIVWNTNRCLIKQAQLIPLEILDGTFVFFRRSICVERAEISSFPCLRIFLARIQPILTGFQFPDH